MKAVAALWAWSWVIPVQFGALEPLEATADFVAVVAAAAGVAGEIGVAGEVAAAAAGAGLVAAVAVVLVPLVSDAFGGAGAAVGIAVGDAGTGAT